MRKMQKMTEEITGWTSALLALGSNIEPRGKYLRRAVEMLSGHPQVRVARRSRLFESRSVEGGGPGDFLNAALEVETGLSSRALLALCQSIESECGREAPVAGEHRPGARTLDLDILCFGEEAWCEPELLLPHPRALRRAFVLRPLLDLLEQGGESSGWVRLSGNWDEEQD